MAELGGSGCRAGKKLFTLWTVLLKWLPRAHSLVKTVCAD